MSIVIGKAIYSLLTSSASTVSTYVNRKVYPLVIPENTALPVIVYERNSDIEYTRDGAGISSSAVDVTVLSEDYKESVDIAQAVHNTLDMYSGSVSGNNIINIRLVTVNETYAENAYIQKLTYEIKSYN